MKVGTKISLILPTFLRASLLDLGLSSISKFKYAYPLEIVVVNDGIEDETEKVCDKYRKFFDIKYYFSGHRNIGNTPTFRVPGFAINIGVKRCTGDVIVLSCPEIYHLTNCLDKVGSLTLNGRYIIIPESMFFDNVGLVTSHLQKDQVTLPIDLFSSLSSGALGSTAVKMPYLMGIQKAEFMAIGGYDEDFTGYAADDNDFVDRLVGFGLEYHRTDVRIIHLYHGKVSSPAGQPDNPAWVHNYNLYKSKKGTLIRNINREWGVL